MYPQWEEEKNAKKIKHEPPKEVFTPEQKAHWEKIKHRFKRPDKNR